MENLTYVGTELELFKDATNWKGYVQSRVTPFLRGRVLEVGAGIGGTTSHLFHENVDEWVCLEPDTALLQTLQQTLQSRKIRIRPGTLSDLSADERFDTILYIDVLEHIDRDAEELQRAAEKLSPNGNLIVLSPAHPSLFSEFDRSIGHFRRYTKKSLRALTPTSLRLKKLFYLDSVGMLASMANRTLLKQSMPNAKQISLWDGLMVPISRILDPVLGYQFGKTVVGIWTRPQI